MTRDTPKKLRPANSRSPLPECADSPGNRASARTATTALNGAVRFITEVTIAGTMAAVVSTAARLTPGGTPDTQARTLTASGTATTVVMRPADSSGPRRYAGDARATQAIA